MDRSVKFINKLIDNENKKIEVHSIFKRNINFLYNDRLYTLQLATSYLTPMSCVCSVTPEIFEEMRERIAKGVEIRNSRLYIGDLEFEILKLEKNLKIEKVQREKNIENLMKNLKRILDINEFSGILFSTFKRLKNNQEIMEKSILEKYLFSQLKNIFSDNFTLKDLEKLLGVGEGLTPSGDDFICGYIAALYFLGEYKKIEFLKEILLFQLKKTTRVSEEYIYYSFKGEFNEYVKELNELCITGKIEDSLDEIVNKIAKIGHSSGIDFIVGFYTGLVKEAKW